MKRTKLSLAMAAAALLITACGGGGSSDSGGASGSSAAGINVTGGGTGTITDPVVPAPVPVPVPVPVPGTPGSLNTSHVPGVYADSAATYAFNALNKVRGNAGVGYLRQVAGLDQAAQSHARYWDLAAGGVTSSSDLHSEVPGTLGFTGVNAQDRAAHFGYPSLMGEVIASGGHYTSMLFNLLGVPYHALTMLSNLSDVGVGFNGSSTLLVMDLGGPRQDLDSEAVAVYPCNNVQVNVQAQGYESPNPAVLNGKQNFGYSSSALVRARQVLEIASWELRDASGAVVPTLVLNNKNDTNGYLSVNQAALIPVDALPRTVTTYTSVLKGKNNGKPFEKSCTWNTVIGQTAPAN